MLPRFAVASLAVFSLVLFAGCDGTSTGAYFVPNASVRNPVAVELQKAKEEAEALPPELESQSRQPAVAAFLEQVKKEDPQANAKTSDEAVMKAWLAREDTTAIKEEDQPDEVKTFIQGWQRHFELAKTISRLEVQLKLVPALLEGMFGTPDEPIVMAETGLDENLVRLAAGPTVSTAEGSTAGYYRRHCVHCHGVTGDGAGPTAAFLNPYPRDFRHGNFKFKSTRIGEKPTDDDLHKIIHDGINGTAMPSFKLLATQEIEALVQYVKYLSIRGQMETALYAKFDELALDELKAAADLGIEKVEPLRAWLADRVKPIEERVAAELVQAKVDLKAAREKLIVEGRTLGEAEKEALRESIKKLSEKVTALDPRAKKLAEERRAVEAGAVELSRLLAAGPLAVESEFTADPKASAELAELTKKARRDGEQPGAEDVAELRTTLVDLVLVEDVMMKWNRAAESIVPVLPRPEVAKDESIKKGQALFYGNGACVKCHGDSAQGDGQFFVHNDVGNPNIVKPQLVNPDLPPQVLRPRNLRYASIRGGHHDADLYRRFYNGIDVGMPGLHGTPGITDEEIWHVVDYVQSLPYEPEMVPQQAAENTRAN